MPKLKYHNYVGVMDDESGMRFVTNIDYQTKHATWSEGTPLKMTISQAKDLVHGLILNGFRAFVCTTLLDISYQSAFVDPSKMKIETG